ncbi:hypothetical protein [Vibrio splendidus]|uniref:hypothetical protein n=1 Tax=Vibrio splendidus TaxID=29497 RepID=UPI000C863353|nr:hypothetical protein [Vibrio splendidus]PMN24112.1 hypothetical protein BCT36_14850 [Vibrio splendidus]
MPLNKGNYSNFFFGTSAEYYVMSRAFYYGLEAHKYNPDFGFDLSITNRARQIFTKEKSKTIDIQVKATYLLSGQAKCYLKEDELNFLLEQENAVTVFCVYKVNIFHERLLFDNDREGLLRLEADIDESYKESLFHDRENGFKVRSESENIEDYEIEIFWFESKQLRNAIELGILNKIEDDEMYVMYINFINGSYVFEATDKNGEKTARSPRVEINKLRYLFRPEENKQPDDYIFCHDSE